MSEPTIEISELTKRYRSKSVLDAANLEVEKGQVVAVLGENGAGKTTTIRTLMGFIKPDSGSVRVFGLDAWKNSTDIRRRVGYVSDDPALYDWMTVSEMGWFCAGFYDGAFGDRYEKLMGEFDVPLKQKIATLSRGQKARIALSLALAAEPELLILDEPTSGLDPIVRREFLQRIREFSSKDKSVLLASHQVEDVERIADAVAILQTNGKYLLAKTSEFKAMFREVQYRGDDVSQLTSLGVDKLVSHRVEDNRTICVLRDVDSEALSRLNLSDLEERELTIEEIFLAIMTAETRTPEPA